MEIGYRSRLKTIIEKTMRFHGMTVEPLKAYEGEGFRGKTGDVAIEIYYYADDVVTPSWCWQLVNSASLENLTLPQMMCGSLAQHIMLVKAVCAGVVHMNAPGVVK